MLCINSFHQSVTAATHSDQENMYNSVKLTNLGLMNKILRRPTICTEVNRDEPNFYGRSM